MIKQFKKLIETYPCYYNLIIPICYKCLIILQKAELSGNSELDLFVLNCVDSFPLSQIQINICCDYINVAKDKASIKNAMKVMIAIYNQFNSKIKYHLLNTIIAALIQKDNFETDMVYQVFELIQKYPVSYNKVILIIRSVYFFWNVKILTILEQYKG